MTVNLDWITPLIAKLQDQLAAHVTSIAVAGSAVHATGEFREIDVICIVTGPSARERFLYADLELDVFVGSQSSFRRALAAGQDHIIRLFAGAKIIWTQDGALNALTEIAHRQLNEPRRPLRPSEDFELRTRPYDLLRKAARQSDAGTKAYLVTLFVDTCVHAFSVRNGRWTLPPHLRLDDVTKRAPLLGRLIRDILKSPADASEDQLATVLNATCGERHTERITTTLLQP